MKRMIASSLAALALIVPQLSAAAVTDQAAYDEAIGCAAVMTVTAAVLGGTKENPTSAEMQKVAEEAKGYAAKWLSRADGLNPGEFDATVKTYNEASMTYTKTVLDAKSKEDVEATFGKDLGRCLGRSKELNLQ
jgi:hypothetical protein